ncbi:MAG: ComF family protein [Deltaproteobacteria bacterium]|nr:ComF family protein [Deltaproteobacteria bacterium]
MKGILTGIADLIFPPRCITCSSLLERHDPLPLCPACAGKIQYIRSPLCTRCGYPFAAATGEDHLCGDCITGEKPFAVARAMGEYEETLLEAIHRFKYKGRTGTGEILGGMMADFAAGIWDMKVFDLIVPVPLHLKKLRQRGFNQAVILARQISKRFGIPLDLTALRRKIFTSPQVGLGREERSANVRGAFSARHPERIDGRRILLVDDVYTTGSTLAECARVLLRANAESVAVLTLARAVRGHYRPLEPEPALPGRDDSAGDANPSPASVA